ncbi:DNA topoisomerase VI subunit B [Candidatus Woesearchaeota archaeon]|nr:DNA topoisomerase VI subunit B [Candidatus Woesearchaeota archaeon]
MSRVAQTKLSETKEKKKYDTKADELATKQREISVSEFFLKNRHLLGFDNPRKSILTAVKEAVDNSLDACEEAGILPHVIVRVKAAEGQDKFKVVVQDNGPGIIPEQVPRIFGKLLYGSKFHKLSQTRGQQGIGISATAMYGQLTTGKPLKVITKTNPKKPAYYCEIVINTKTNEPQIIKEEYKEWDEVQTGTKLAVEMEAIYQKGKRSVDEYLKLTAISNPHTTITYYPPDSNDAIEFPRVTDKMPKEAKEIKPHPYGVELGMLMKMLQDTKATTLQSFLQTDFCRVSAHVAKEICDKAKLYEKARPARIARQEAEALYKSIQETKIMAPPSDCVSPIGEELLVKSLQKEVTADFYAAITRPPSVYRGNPFVVECAIAFGNGLPQDELVQVFRYANRVPLQYEQSACAVSKSIVDTTWRNYGLQQSRGALPLGPMVLMVHLASVWVPFTSESKEAIASYPEIVKEIKLALQECGRKLGIYIRKNIKAKEQRDKANLLERFIPEVAGALHSLTGESKSAIEEKLKMILARGLPALLKAGDEEKEEEKDGGQK